MTDDKLPGTENMKCAIGLYEGSREYVDGPFKGTKVYGVFSYVDVSDKPCDEPVRFWCKRKGSNHAWLACGNPEHRRDAEAVLPLTPEYIAFLVWQQKPGQPMPELLANRAKRDPFLDAPKQLVQAPQEPKALLPPKKQRCIPRNKCPTCHQPRYVVGPNVCSNAFHNNSSRRAKAIGEAAQAASKVFAGVMGLVEKSKEKL